jgi:hypothetical protein
MIPSTKNKGITFFMAIEVFKIQTGNPIKKDDLLTDMFRLNFDIFLFYSLLKTNEK